MKTVRLVSLVTALTCMASSLAGKSDTPTAEEILDRVDDLFRGDSSRGEMTMKITTAHWSRELSMEFWNMGKDKSLVRILSPKKEKGTATLRSGNEIWNYLPKVRRVIKLPSSMMSASWMGSHFTNDDLVKESRMAEDYTFEVTFEGERDGVRIIEITCTPREDAAIVWGKAVVTVRHDDLMPLSILYYDEDLALARTMTFADFRMLGGRMLPARAEIVPADKPDESTVVIYDKMVFDEVFPDDLFSLRTLQR